jgi:hypothetical protein
MQYPFLLEVCECINQVLDHTPRLRFGEVMLGSRMYEICQCATSAELEYVVASRINYEDRVQ